MYTADTSVYQVTSNSSMNTQDTVEKFVEELKDLGWFHSTHGKEAFSFTQIQWIRKTLTAKEKKDGLLLV